MSPGYKVVVVPLALVSLREFLWENGEFKEATMWLLLADAR